MDRVNEKRPMHVFIHPSMDGRWSSVRQTPDDLHYVPVDPGKDVPDTFSTALERLRNREEIRAMVTLIVLILAGVAGVLGLSNYAAKVAVLLMALPLFLAHAFYYSSSAIFHRSWMKANKEVYGR